MAESIRLMHSLSFHSGMPNQPNNHGNHVHVLGDSVSLGRFRSESLAWEKWSAFSHNRYVEEAKSYVQPGSVAQKKAFFEAHYTRFAAQNTGVTSPKLQVLERICGTDCGSHESEATMVLNSKMVVNEEQQIITQNDCRPVDSSVILVKSGTEKIEIVAELKSTELSNHTQNPEDHVSVFEDSRTSQMEAPLLKDCSQPRIRRKPTKYVASMHTKKGNVVTPRTRNSSAMDSIDDKKPSPRSLYMSMTSGFVRESNKFNSPAVGKIESTNGVNTQSLPSPCVKLRMETPVHPSAVGSKKLGKRWHIFLAVLKSVGAYRNELQSPTTSSTSVLRTGQNVDEKFSEKAAQKFQLRTSSKETITRMKRLPANLLSRFLGFFRVRFMLRFLFIYLFFNASF